MNNIVKYISWFLKIAIVVAIWCFGYFVYPGHVFGEVYLSMFNNTISFFATFIEIPSGLSQWIGAFMSSLYNSLWLAATIKTSSVVLMYFLTRIICRKCAIIPAFILFLLQTNIYFTASQTLQLLVWVALLCLFLKIESRLTRCSLLILLAYFAVWSVGCLPFCILYVIIALNDVLKRNYVSALTAFVMIPLSALFWVYVYGVDYKQWYVFFPEMMELFHFKTIVAFYVSVALLLFFSRRLYNYKYTTLFSFLGIVVFAILGYSQYYFPKLESLWCIQKYVVTKDWNGLIDFSDCDYGGEQQNFYVARNLALAHKGELPEKLLDYKQVGMDGLIPSENDYFFSNTLLSDIYELLGSNNEALHQCVEGGMVSYGKSAFVMARNAELLMKMGKESTAVKFLRNLVSEPNFDDWAMEMLEKCAVVERLNLKNAFEQSPKENYSDLVRDTNDFMIRSNGPYADLFVLADKYPGNVYVRDYLLCSLLLQRDLGNFYFYFKKYYALGSVYSLPKLYQEALAVISYTKLDVSAFKSYSGDGNIYKSFSDYMTVAHSYGNDKEAAKSALMPNWGKTFWYYMHFGGL